MELPFLANSRLSEASAVGRVFLFATFSGFIIGAGAPRVLADTTLQEVVPDNNNGGMTWFNCGVTLNGTRNRGLVKFDIAGNVPAGSRITDGYLQVSVLQGSVDAGPNSEFLDLHRVLRDWGEGTNTTPSTSNGNRGTPATVGEATWNDRFALTTNHWGAPGAEAEIDYLTDVSAEQVIYNVAQSPFFFSSTPQFLADLQLWLDHPQANFGLILIPTDETTAGTARRFGSREGDPDLAPQLFVVYTPPIGRVEAVGNQFRLHFTAQAGQAYEVDYASNLNDGAVWQTLTNVPAPMDTTNVVVTDTIGGQQRFYRLKPD